MRVCVFSNEQLPYTQRVYTRIVNQDGSIWLNSDCIDGLVTL
jgi:hypothetical protein